MATSTEILQRFLDALGHSETFMDKYAILYADLVRDQQPEDVSNALLNSLERYIQAQRVKILINHWGDLGSATPAMADEVSVPQDVLARINRIVMFYGVPRTALFLYVHAHLLNILFDSEAVHRLDEILDELDPR